MMRRSVLPLFETRMVATIAFAGGALGWVVLWTWMASARHTGVPETDRTRVLFRCAQLALGPVGALFSQIGSATPHGPSRIEITLASVENGCFWALLLGAANWGRSHLRALMWAILGFIALGWMLIGVVVVQTI